MEMTKQSINRVLTDWYFGDHEKAVKQLKKARLKIGPGINGYSVRWVRDYGLGIPFSMEICEYRPNHATKTVKIGTWFTELPDEPGNWAEKLKSAVLADDWATTDNPSRATFVFADGTMTDGEWDCGSRGLDHNFIKGYLDELLAKAREAGETDLTNAWEFGFKVCRIVMMVPECRTVYAAKGQRMTAAQLAAVRTAGYRREAFC